MAYGLFLFIRDICDGDLVGWIDQRLQAVPNPSSPDFPERLGQAFIGPMRHVFGVSHKVLNMTLADLLIGADPDRSLWRLAGQHMIAIDTLIHNLLHRTGTLAQCNAEHASQLLAKVRKPLNRWPWPQRGHLLRAATLKIQPVLFLSGHWLEARALATFFLLDQLLQELMSEGLVRDLVAHLGGPLAVACADRENSPVNRVAPGVSSPINLDVDGVALHADSPPGMSCGPCNLALV